MPTAEKLQQEADDLENIRNIKRNAYESAYDTVLRSNSDLVKAQQDYNTVLQQAKISIQKAADLANATVTNETMTLDQKDAVMKSVKSIIDKAGQSIAAAKSDLSAEVEANKYVQKNLDAAQKDLAAANAALNDKRIQLQDQQYAESQQAALAQQQAQNQVIDNSAAKIDAEIAEFKKSSTGLTGFNPDTGCENLLAQCDACSVSRDAAQQACADYNLANTIYAVAKQNTIQVANQQTKNQANLSTQIIEIQNTVDGYNKSISAGIGLLKDMATNGSTETQRNRLSENIQKNQEEVNSLKARISYIEDQIKEGEKKISDAKDAEQKALDDVTQRRTDAKIALAELASCNLKCQKTSVGTQITTKGSTDSGTGKSQGAVELNGGASGPTGSTGQTGPTEPKLQPSEFSGTSGPFNWYWVTKDGSASGFAGLSGSWGTGFNYIRGDLP